jgi:putative methionine-R-sulfoxide reductase with GAF domain/predicted Ser/Thr protein kinase
VSRAGETLLGGRYELLGPISSGAMGAVFRASDGGREVAVKRLIDTGQSARFEIEARLLERLRHPRVVQVIDYVHDGDDSFLVMDLVRGPDLARAVRQRGSPGLPLDEVLEITRQAADALEYVHEQQVVHRDVKPQNLIAGEDGVVLVDFGIARGLGEDGSTRGVGTPRFMAPEVMVGEGVSPRSDVYGLAATVWNLLAGEPPSYGAPDPLPDVPPELERALRRALDLRPERRFASAAALAAALGSPVETAPGASLAASLPDVGRARQGLLEAVVRTAAAIFDAAAVSIALRDEKTAELVYHAAWGAAADEIVGVRLARGEGIAGAALAGAEPVVVPECRTDPRFAARIAAGTGYVPNTLLVVPLVRDGDAVGALSILDRRDGGAYSDADVERAQLFAELSVAALA